MTECKCILLHDQATASYKTLGLETQMLPKLPALDEPYLVLEYYGGI